MKTVYRRLVLGLVAILLVLIVGLLSAMRYTSSCPEDSPERPADGQARAVVYECYGGTDVLQITGIAEPELADDEILIRVKAAGVNPLDWHFMRGTPYFMRLMSGIGRPAANRLGVDFSGTVEAVGSNITKFKPGDDVFGGHTGSFADHVVVRESSALALKPATISFDEAAGVGIAGVTALQALRDNALVSSGQKVLINGASGGVGTFAVQIAKSMGAEVYGVCSTRNVELVRSLGADRVFDYKTEDYTQSEIEFDVIIDMVGNHGLSANRRVLKPGGVMVIVGGGDGDWIGPMVNPLKAMLVAPFTEQRIEMILAELRQDDLEYLAELMAQGQLETVLDRSYPLESIREAIEHSETGRARGKIIVNP